MGISCKIIEDLLPLYHDGVCSEESKLLVEQHLNGCEPCTKYFELMSSESLNENLKVDTEAAKINAIKNLKKKLLRKNMMISILSILSFAIISVSGWYLVFHYNTPINYTDGLVEVSLAYDGVLDITFNGKDYYMSHELTKTIEKDGVTQDVVFLYFSETLWTKYISKPDVKSAHIAIGNGIIVDYNKQGEVNESSRDVSAVYYLIGDYPTLALAKQSDEKFATIMQDAVLLWER